MKKAIAQTASNINEYRAKITLVVLVACALTAAFYAINLYSLVSRTVALGQMEKQTAKVASEINSLDAEYLKLSSTITPDTMSRYGLEKTQVSFYITRPSPTAYNR